jgi:hypothetical protein
VNRDVLVAGGVGSTGTPTPTAEIYHPSAPVCREGDGDGEIKGKQSGMAHFHLHGTSCDAGDVEEDDEGSGTHFRSAAISSVTFTSNKWSRAVTMIGTGFNNGVPVQFTMVAGDAGPVVPGVFSLVLTDGYSITGSLVNGSIVIWW